MSKKVPIVLNDELKVNERYLLMYLLSCEDHHPNIEEIIETTNFSRTATSQYISSLRRKGYIVESKNGKYKQFHVVLTKILTYEKEKQKEAG